MTGNRRPYTSDELIEEIEFMLGQGCLPWEIAEALGISEQNLEARLRRYDRKDLASLFNLAGITQRTLRLAS